MSTTYNVRIWKTKVYKGKRVTSHYVRWCVDGIEFKNPFRTSAQADSFRADLLSAARKGEAFFVDTGLPVSLAQRQRRDISWFAYACSYVDHKWPRAAVTTRRTNAEALTAITVALITSGRDKPDDRLIRSSLLRFAFNTARRDTANRSDEVRQALAWISTHTRRVASLSEPDVIRAVLDSLTIRLDGSPRSSVVVTRWRKVFNNAMEYAVEQKLLTANPLSGLKWTAPRAVNTVDRRSVVNPIQARSLLAAVREQPRIGAQMVTLFGCLYFAGLRPEEAAALSKHHLSLPASGWGELHLDRAKPFAGKDWTTTGEDRDDRQLKQRAVNEVRIVPCPPELTAMLHEHLSAFGTTPDGRLFVGERDRDQLPRRTMMRVWSRAREAAFTPAVADSPLARTPYDLRHAAVSTWLNAGVPATTVAEWAGHSVEVLLSIYAKCLDGETARLRNRVIDALGGPAG
jgi:integrase